jgi:hypothetical protein
MWAVIIGGNIINGVPIIICNKVEDVLFYIRPIFAGFDLHSIARY